MNGRTTPHIVVIGGGTGSFTLLSSLKNYTKNITSVVNMVDDGGSTGKLRDELGALPPGDVRQCLVALSDASDELRDLFNYRFSEGTLAGHSFGNLFLTALEQAKSGFGESVAIASRILNVQGEVAPVTLTSTKLVMKLDGEETVGQFNVEVNEFDGSKRPEFSLSPSSSLNPIAEKAILEADLIVIAPGNLYSSLLPNFLVGGMKQAIEESPAKVVMVSNLVNKRHQTNGLKVSDYIDILEKYIGEGQIDHVIYNDSEPPTGLLEKYAQSGELPVAYDKQALAGRDTEMHGEALISEKPVERSSNDKLMAAPRNFIRHDADKVSRVLMRIFYS